MATAATHSHCIAPYKPSYAAALWQWLRVAVVRCQRHAWLGRSQYKVEKRRWQCTNWIQRARLSERLLLLVPYKPSDAAALWQWLRVAVVRDKCQACLERPQWVTGEWTSQCEHSIQRVPLGGGKQLASASRQHGTHRGIIV